MYVLHLLFDENLRNHGGKDRVDQILMLFLLLQKLQLPLLCQLLDDFLVHKSYPVGGLHKVT